MLGPEHPRTLATIANFGKVFLHRLTFSTAHALACVIARQGRKKEALSWLGRAIEGGVRDPKGFAESSDLASLRGDPEFERLAAAARS